MSTSASATAITSITMAGEDENKNNRSVSTARSKKHLIDSTSDEIRMLYDSAAASSKSGLGSSGIRVSSLPLALQQEVHKMGLDVDGDGTLDTHEIIAVVNNLATTSKENDNMKKIILVLVIFAVLLVCCVFGATITAARLSKETSIDVMTGAMYAKGTTTSMKTSEFVEYTPNTVIATMTNEELDELKYFYLGDDLSMKFFVKGYTRPSSPQNDGVSGDDAVVVLLVEGGVIFFDSDGIRDATGDAKMLLDLFTGNTNVDDYIQAEQQSDTRRRLQDYLSQVEMTTGSNQAMNKYNRSF